MNYKGSARDIIYPSASREPHVARYRILPVRQSRVVRAIVHLVHYEPKQPQQPPLAAAFDVVLNRIIGEDADGDRPGCIQPVVESNTDVVEYPIRFNALEYGHPRRTGKTPVGSKDEAVHIQSRDVTGGSVAFHVDRREDQPATPRVMKRLR